MKKFIQTRVDHPKKVQKKQSLFRLLGGVLHDQVHQKLTRARRTQHRRQREIKDYRKNDLGRMTRVSRSHSLSKLDTSRRTCKSLSSVTSNEYYSPSNHPETSREDALYPKIDK